MIEPVKENKTKRKGAVLKKLNALHERVSNLPDIGFLILMFICSYIMAAITSQLYDVFVDFESMDTSFFGFDVESTFIIAVILSPLFETIEFQFFPIEICMLIYKKSREIKPNYIFIVLFSASIFGLAHFPAYAAIGGTTFGIIKVINTFPVGLILAYTYLVYKLKAGRPVIATAILHSMLNFSFIMLSKL